MRCFFSEHSYRFVVELTHSIRELNALDSKTLVYVCTLGQIDDRNLGGHVLVTDSDYRHQSGCWQRHLVLGFEAPSGLEMEKKKTRRCFVLILRFHDLSFGISRSNQDFRSINNDATNVYCFLFKE